jgi:membrane associated rhomboid family serine protease
MIPLKDHNPTERTPFVTLVFLALNVATFLLWQPLADAGDPARAYVCQSVGFTTEPQGQCQQLTEGDLFSFCHGAIPAEITELEQLSTLDRVCGEKSPLLSLLTSMFLHGGLLHIAGNMLYLWVFGNNVEDRLGHAGFVVFYLLAGVAAAYAQAWSSPDSVIPMIGASGAIAGTLGAYLVMFPRARIVTLIPLFFFLQLAELPAVVVLGFWFVLQAFQGVGSLGADVGGVAWWAHIGGFVFGAAVALLFYRRRPRPAPVASPFDPY